MKNNMFSFFFLIIFLLIIGCTDSSNGPSTGTITGLVISRTDGLPISGALIKTEPPTEIVLTDAEGKFSITCETGIYIVSADKDKFYKNSESIKVSSGKSVNAIIQLIDWISGNHPPEEPVDPIPTNKSKRSILDITLSWTCSDEDDDPIRYDIYFGKTNPPTELIKVDYNKTTLQVKDLQDSTTYYWKVTAKDIYGATRSSEIWNFAILKSPKPDEGTLNVLYLPFNGNADDESGNNLNGTVYNAVLTDDRFGNGNSAYSFDGSSYILIPYSSLLNIATEYTVCMWIKPSPGYGLPQADYIDLVSRWVGPSSSYLFAISGTGKLAACVVADASNASYLLSSVVVPHSTWSHIAYVKKGNKMYYYMDGYSDAGTVIMNQQASLKDLYIGIRESKTAGFTGSLDDIRIYNKALSDSEIKDLSNDR